MSEQLDFVPPDVSAVVAALGRGGQWVNLQADVDPDDVPPPPSGLFAIFGNRGPTVPFCTWHPGERSAGIQHASGPRLRERIKLPAGWRVTHDHPKRGLVVHVPLGVGDAEVVAWLVAVATPLGPLAEEGRWLAEVFP